MNLRNVIPWTTDNRVTITTVTDDTSLVKTSFANKSIAYQLVKIDHSELDKYHLPEDFIPLVSLYDVSDTKAIDNTECVIRYTRCGTYSVTDDTRYELQASAVFECEDPAKCNESYNKEYYSKFKDFSDYIDMNDFTEWRLNIRAQTIKKEDVDKAVAFINNKDRVPQSMLDLYQAYKRAPKNIKPESIYTCLKLGGLSFNEQMFENILNRLTKEGLDMKPIRRVYIERSLTPERKTIDIRETVIEKGGATRKTFKRRHIVYSTKVLDAPCEVYYELPIEEFGIDSECKTIYLQYIMSAEFNNWFIQLVSDVAIRYDDSDKLALYLPKLKADISSNNTVFKNKSIEMIWANTDTKPTYRDFINAANIIMNVSQYTVTVRQLADILGRGSNSTTLKEITNAPTSIDRVSYSRIYPPYDYMITEKTEGIHAIVWINDGEFILITNDILKIPMKNTAKASYIFEGEVIPIDNDSNIDPSTIKITSSNIKDYRFLVFDILMFDSELITDEVAQVRISKLDEAIDIIKPVMPAIAKEFITVTGPTDANEALTITDDAKAYIKDSFNKIWKRVYDYEIDGIIIQDASKPYYSMNIYKWKPADKLSIDFLIKECPAGLLGKFPYTSKPNKRLYWLMSGISHDMFIQLHKKLPAGYSELFSAFSLPEVTAKAYDKRGGPQHDKRGDRNGKYSRDGVNRNGKHRGGRETKIVNSNYFPINFSPSDDPLSYLFWASTDDLQQDTEGELDGRIGEFVYIDNEWHLLRIRYDRDVDLESGKYYGNNYAVAELTWESIRNPLNYDDLYNYDAARGYFQEEKHSIYKAQTGYNSHVKTNLIYRYSKNARWLIDLAGGRGADIGRYSDAKVNHVTIVDVDRDALTELVARKVRYRKELMDLTTIHSDLNDINTTVDKLKTLQKNIALPETADIIVCNFAIHYMIDTIESFAKGIAELVKKGGYFIYTCLDGEKVHNMLHADQILQGESWIAEEKGYNKYQIQRKYKSDELTEKGQIIAVKLPFSRGELYDEQLVNIAYVNSCFESNGFKVSQYGSFNPAEVDNTSKSSSDYAKNKGYDNSSSIASKQLSESDKQWVSLYSYCVLEKQ